MMYKHMRHMVYKHMRHIQTKKENGYRENKILQPKETEQERMKTQISKKIKSEAEDSIVLSYFINQKENQYVLNMARKIRGVAILFVFFCCCLFYTSLNTILSSINCE